MPTIKLDNGSTFTGTPKECALFVEEIGGGTVPRGWYLSTSRGPILISEMPLGHAGNALIKAVKDWASGLGTTRDYPTPNDLISELEKGYVQDPSVKDLFARVWLSRRQPNWKDR